LYVLVYVFYARSVKRMQEPFHFDGCHNDCQLLISKF
jgi:hypothetical protein